MTTLIVADSNLLSPSCARRFLAGLACEFGHRLGLVPALEDELPRVLRRELLRRETQRLRRLDSTESALAEVDARVHEAAGAWLPAVVSSANSPFVRCCTTREERMQAVRMEVSELRDAFAGGRLAERAADESIVSQSLAAHADYILTNNMASISHSRVNAYAASLGYNHDVLQPPGIAFARLLDPERDAGRTLLAALSMSVSDSHRHPDAERESLMRFLHFAGVSLGYPAALAEEHALGLHDDAFHEMLREARSNTARSPWRCVRQAEARMQREARPRSTEPKR